MKVRNRKTSALDHAFPARGATDSLIANVATSLLKRRCMQSTVRSASLLATSRRNPSELPSIDPRLYDNCTDFASDYQAISLVSKYPFGEGAGRTVTALAKFHEAELQCKQTNVRLASPTQWISKCPLWPAVQMTARRKIERALGRFDLGLIERYCGFGPGASTSLRRTRGDLWYKFGHKPDVTYNCATLAWVAVYRIPLWFEHLTGVRPTDRRMDFANHPPEQIFNLVRGNRVATVPKNFKTDRVIAIEPDLNMFCQKGLGGLIRNRLLRVGVNLNTQVPNQALARLGSITGLLATVDLSSASDTVSLGVCEALLPDDWLAAIKLCRSQFGVLPDGSEILYGKVSSMGNGFTFELESLIFWAITQSVSELSGQQGIAVVYGDDILCPYGIQHDLREVLSFAGFTVNEEKSFFDGPFRESCGKHYFLGSDVTPIYIRERPTSFPDVVALCNKLRRAARLSWGLDGNYLEAYTMLIDILPGPFRVAIPEGFGDVGLLSDFDEAVPKWDRHSQSFSFKTVQPDRRILANQGDVPLLLKSLFGLEASGDGGDRQTEGSAESFVDVRVNTGRWRLSKSHTHSWPSYGPWLIQDLS